ncbi:somatostatin receptor type 4 [Plakobranchus ocellatus]|uniref:Somatostatin receptor type 4 n=1 Tax=Plakobranchus ocellatus TaxID=259542 RepID=A0AAV4BEI9_9GAST|nr:somatostatin receptor type 4 [Plakobranchus ocellatus]
MTGFIEMENTSCNMTCGCMQSLERMENAIRVPRRPLKDSNLNQRQKKKRCKTNPLDNAPPRFPSISAATCLSDFGHYPKHARQHQFLIEATLWPSMIVRIGNILSIYVLPCIILPGIVLNGVSCLVFSSTDLKKLSSSVYISALLVADTGVLTGLLFVWLEAIGFKVNPRLDAIGLKVDSGLEAIGADAIGIKVNTGLEAIEFKANPGLEALGFKVNPGLETIGFKINHVNGICQGLVFFTYMFSYLSVWYVVCVTVENYITICHPCRIKTMCTRRRATATCVCVFIASVFLYAATLFVAEVRYSPGGEVGICSEKPQYRQFMQVFTYVDSVLTLLVPLIAISCMLVGLVLSVLQATRWKNRMGSLPLIKRAPTPPPRNKKAAAAAASRSLPPISSITDNNSSSQHPAASNDNVAHAQAIRIKDGYKCYHDNTQNHSEKAGTADSTKSENEATRSWKRSKPTSRPKTAQMRVTRMLFALSVSFVVMNAPSHVTRLYYLIRSMHMFSEGNENNERCQLTYTEGLINLALQYVTYAYNASKFWIFILFSKNFVKSLARLIRDSWIYRSLF